jgi:hypothetical protein
LPDLALNNFLLPLIPSVPGPSLIEKATRQIRAVIAPSKPGEISADRNTMQAPTVAVHIGMKDANGWRGVAANYHPNGALQKIPEYDLKMQYHFMPYESLLEIPCAIQNIESVQSLALRIYRGKTDPDNPPAGLDDRCARDASHLVYQEVFDSAALTRLRARTLDWQEPLEVKRQRTARYWGLECFANWYHQTYTIELWVSTAEAAFLGCDGRTAPQKKPAVTMHNHSSTVEPAEGHAAWVSKTGPEALGYRRIRAADVIHQLFNYDRSPALFPWMDDYGRIQRFTRNIPKYLECLKPIEDYLQHKPRASLLEALEYHEQATSFPKVQVIPLSGLPGPDFLHLTQHAYPLDDIGAGTTHGVYTHRLQWAAISNLVTARYTLGRRPEFYHTPLQLYVRAGDPALHAPSDGSYFCTRFDFPIPLFQWLCDRTGEPLSIPIFFVEEGEDGPLHHADALHMFLLTGVPRTKGPEAAIAELARQMCPDNPYRFKLSSTDVFFAPPNHLQTTVLEDFNLAGTHAQLWLGRFVERLNKQYLTGSVFKLLGIKSYTWDGREDDAKLAGLLKSVELEQTGRAIEKLAKATPPLPLIARRLMPLWLEMRIAVIAGQLVIAGVNNQLRRTANDKATLPTLEELVRAEDRPEPNDLAQWAVRMLTPAEVQHMLDLNRNLINLTPLWPWTKPLRWAVDRSSISQLRYMIGYQATPIDAVMQRTSSNLSGPALERLLDQSEHIVKQGDIAAFSPIGIFFFEGSPQTWKEYGWSPLTVDQMLE